MSFLSSLFGMNAAELSGDSPTSSPSSTVTAAPLQTPSSDEADDGLALPGRIPGFWPTTFRRQVFIICNRPVVLFHQ